MWRPWRHAAGRLARRPYAATATAWRARPDVTCECAARPARGRAPREAPLHLPGFLRALSHGRGVFLVQCPLEGIAGNVPPDAVQFLLVADDVFVEITLPYGLTRAAAHQVYTLGGHRFERADHPTQWLAPHGAGSRTGLISTDDNDA